MPETTPETKSQPESTPMSEAPLIEHPTHSLDDMGNILRAKDSMRDLWAFVPSENQLFHWTGQCWSEDHGKRKMLKAAVKAVEESLLDECDEIEKLAEHYEDRLETAGFYFPEAKANAMKRTMRNLWSRMPLTRADVQMLHGVLRQMVLWKERGE